MLSTAAVLKWFVSIVGVQLMLKEFWRNVEGLLRFVSIKEV